MMNPSILIIDDERELCILLENFLSKKSREIDYRNDLESGFERFREMKPDLLILDHNLPDGFGIDNIGKFRELKSNVKIIIISAMSNLRSDALAKGADHFIEKPISFRQLNLILEE